MGFYEYQKLEPSLNGWEYFFTFLIGFILTIIIFYISKKMYFSVKESGSSHGILSSLFPVFHNMTKISHTIPVSLMSGFFGGLFCLIVLVLSNLILFYIDKKIKEKQTTQ